MKYKLTKNTVVNIFGKTLFQIEALKDFSDVEKGDLGGYIEKEENLSQEDDAWVYGNAEVYGNAWVYGDARVYGNAEVYGDARVYGNAWVYGDARVSGKIKLTLGYFFGMRYNKEEIKYIENEGQEIICKGDIEVNKEEKSKETIKIGDVEFDKEEVEKRLKGLKPIE